MKSIKLRFKEFINSIVLLGVGTLIFVSPAHGAGTVLSIESNIGGGDHNSRGFNSQAMIDSTGMRWADHNTTRWQELGTTGGLGDYGVSWSTNGTDFGHDDLMVGQNVTFKFNMHSREAGTHYANLMKGWIHWDTNSTDYKFDNNNYVIAGGNELRNYRGANLNSDSTDDLILTYNLTLTNDHVGTAYLRARVTCSESINQVNFGGGWSSQWSRDLADYKDAFDAFSDYYQGEIEDWKFTVSANQVPEPATMFLFGMGLIGMGALGRRKNFSFPSKKK